MKTSCSPLLSIGMIFKNEIRCLERCMKSLAPLREAVSCELVMADTGSNDGSREIAGKYADILIDFPWADDFAAARNAVMERCSGEWYFSIDADEWLDENIEELVCFLVAEDTENAASLVIRNYLTPELETSGEFGDFFAPRLLRMSTGLRFEGVIHECWHENGKRRFLPETRLFHDGYAYSSETGRAVKRERNMALLRKKLEDEPENLHTLVQCIESARGGPQYVGYVYRAVECLRRKPEGWETNGPAVLRHAVIAAHDKGFPEEREWVKWAEDWFPNSMFTRIDVEFTAFTGCWDREEYDAAVVRGERYLSALEEYRKFPESRGVVVTASPFWERTLRIFLAGSYGHIGQKLRGRALLASLDGACLDGGQTENYLRVFRLLYEGEESEGAGELAPFWERINVSEPSEKKRLERRRAFLRQAALAFAPGAAENAAAIFLSLAGKCEMGTAAAILEENSPAEIEKLLETVEKWGEFPIFALEYALSAGVRFPLANKPLKLEEMDMLAGRLSRDTLERLAIESGTKDLPSLLWARGIALAAVQSCEWNDEETGLELARAFAKIEREFLPRYYTSELLCSENIQFLPPMHRFGWYCSQAFETLNDGDKAGYVHWLREGLYSCEMAKNMVEFLLEHTPELQTPEPKPSGELLELAEKVRITLSTYPPDDPAVVAIKASPVYKKVAHLIEGPEVGLFGGGWRSESRDSGRRAGHPHQ